MRRPDWDRVEELFAQASALPPGERAHFIAREASDDPALAEELIRLLAASEGAAEYLDRLRDDLLGAEVQDLLEGTAGTGGADPWIGRTVSHYRVLEHLGHGGMGVVYRAHDLNLDRRVALKFIAPEISRDPAAKGRFLHEARAASAMDHPNICTIHEIAEAEGDRLFIVMPAYEGETLRSRMTRGPLPETEAVGIAEEVARALAAAHEHGIVHGDVTPTNVFITKEGGVKLLDFGLANAGDRVATDEPKLRGTVPYMSPEQARGGAADERSDVWAAGVILFEMLAGRRPFSADDPEAVVDLILNHSPDVAGLGSDVSQRLAVVIGKALSKDPEGRFENGTTLAHALSACKPVVTAWAGMRARLAGARHRPVTALGLLLAVVVVGWGGWRSVGGSRDAGLSVTHVLWADDNPENNAAVMLRLRERGVRVTTTLSTAETLERYDPVLHQLVVSDVGRFEGDNGEYAGRAGLDLLARLKERHQRVQLLFCTSHRAAAAYREEALAAGALGIVTNCEEVLALIGL